MEKKPNYVVRVFVGIAISFGLAIINMLIPFFIGMLIGSSNSQDSLHIFLRMWQFVVPVLIILIGTPIIIAICCLLKKKAKAKTNTEVQKEVQ